MHGYTKIAIERIVFALLLALIVLMTLVRAYLIPPTQDEVISFFEYAISDSSWMLDTRTSNNHLLNTILGKACTLLFGLNMFAFRLTNVLALILYGLGVWRIGSRLKFEMKWLLMINLLFAYPIIEYFGLARGYGISFAFLLLQLSYLLEYVTQRKLKDLYLSVLCLGLAVFANLGLTVHLVVSLGVMVLSNMLPMQRPKYWFPVVCSGVFVVIFGTIGSGLNRNNELYFGQSAGFYNTTVDSLLNMFEYSTDSVLTVLFLGSLLVLVALSVLSDLPPRRTEFTSSPKSILCLVFALNVLGTICLAEAFDINYPSERVGLYFVILFLLHSAFAINEVRWKSLRIGILSANIVLTIGILTHTTMAFSLEKSGVEPFAHLSANSFKRIAAASEVEEILPIVSGDERLSFAYRYYSFINDARVNPIINGVGNSEEDLSSELIDLEGLEVYLEQKLSRAEWIDIKADYVTLSKFAVQDSGEYVLTLDIELEADDKPKVALVLTVVHESDDKEIYYEAQRIDGLLKHDACTKMRSYKLRFEEPVEVHFYLFNIEEKRFTVHAVENRILRVIKT